MRDPNQRIVRLLSRSHWLLAAFSVLLVATRLPVVHASIHLPDASLAAFFVAGLTASSSRALIALLATALALDGLSCATGTSMACVSPAYPALLLAYAVMWFGGRVTRTSPLMRRFAALLVTTTASFLVSSGSYYVLSGHFASPTWTGMLPRVAMYLPHVLLETAVYGLVGLFAAAWLNARTSSIATSHTNE